LSPLNACRRERGRENRQSFALTRTCLIGGFASTCRRSVGRSCTALEAGYSHLGSRVHRVAPAPPPSQLAPLGDALEGFRSSTLSSEGRAEKLAREGDKSAEAVPLDRSTCKPSQVNARRVESNQAGLIHPQRTPPIKAGQKTSEICPSGVFAFLALNIEILNHWFEFLRFIAPGIKTSSQDRERPVAWVNGEGRDNAPACVILDIDVRRVVIELGLLKRGQSIDVRRPGSHN